MSTDHKCPFQVDVYCSGGRTPLMVAAANANIPMVKCAERGMPGGVCAPGAATLPERSNRPRERRVGDCCESLYLLLDLIAYYRVNKKGIDFGQMTINRNLLPSTVFPTTSCMLNWHNASLSVIANEWLLSACLQLNQRLRTSRMALSALTRIDISSNQLIKLNSSLLQLQSLRNLNAANNVIEFIEMESDDWNAPMLESLSLEHNKIKCLPPQIFSSRLPNLSMLDVSHNQLISLPETLWLAPRLRELNASNNLLMAIPQSARVSSHPPSVVGVPSSGSHASSIVSTVSSSRTNSVSSQKSATPNRHHPVQEHTNLMNNLINSSSNFTASANNSYNNNYNNGVVGGTSAGSICGESRTFHSTISTEDSLSINGRMDDPNIQIHELKRHNLWQASVRLARSDESDTEGGTIISSSTLSILNLSHNNLKVLPPCLACCCPRLARLNVAYNKLTSLGAIECLPSRLRHLDVSNNQLVCAFQKVNNAQLICHATSSASGTSISNGMSQLIRQSSPTRNPSGTCLIDLLT
ncbi:unnamed protein product [Anisakis simplex]|uniref:PPM-type phosphatase domain-containing protein n=1 Tax=Anisakis simplex TaxID=6269 RepID=A0A0M3J1C9_ANISI|nr:unnamed protein product [Anisakis simplex]